MTTETFVTAPRLEGVDALHYYTSAAHWPPPTGVPSSHALAFRNARPFPHLVIDDFLAEGLLALIANQFPSPESPFWKEPTNAHTVGKQVMRTPAGSTKEEQLPIPIRQLIWELHSARFLTALTALTGISGLIGDPYLAEAGLHSIKPGGKLDIHADFSRSDYLGLDRRLNLLLYFNHDWPETYGGHLCLYDPDLTERVRILPVAGRVVIFATSKTSYHGHPTPVACPPGRFRRSLALYYYTCPEPKTGAHRIIFPEDPMFQQRTVKVTGE